MKNLVLAIMVLANLAGSVKTYNSHDYKFKQELYRFDAGYVYNVPGYGQSPAGYEIVSYDINDQGHISIRSDYFYY